MQRPSLLGTKQVIIILILVYLPNIGRSDELFSFDYFATLPYDGEKYMKFRQNLLYFGFQFFVEEI